jgi:hypothetical protein
MQTEPLQLKKDIAEIAPLRKLRAHGKNVDYTVSMSTIKRLWEKGSYFCAFRLII